MAAATGGCAGPALPERQPAVDARHGPRVTQLDAELHRLRINAERQGTVEEIERRWNALGAQAADAAERAAHKEFDAERTRWWQPGRREQLHAEAAADKALSQRLQAQAAELAHPAAELQRQLGGPGLWKQARERAERAETAYPQDRQRAHDADQRELDRLRDRANSRDTAAHDAAIRRTELLAEQLLRATMPEPQATFENELRTQAIQQQHIDQATPELHSDSSPSLQSELSRSRQMDPDYDHRSIEPDIDRDGPGLAL